MNKNKKLEFPMPSNSNLQNRISTINNSFVQSIIPRISEKDQVKLKKYYEELGIEQNQCVYCLKKGKVTGDHLHPLIKDKMPTGYITDINNIVPCCPDCNSSKGGKEFIDWYKSDCNVKRLNNFGISDEQINQRYKIIVNYINNHHQEPLNLKDVFGEDDWNEFNKIKNQLEEKLKECKEFCDKLLVKTQNYLMNHDERHK